jgi:hypothetical protein
MTADIEKEEFVSGQFRAAPGHPSSSAIMVRARTQLWKTFCGTKMKAVQLKGVEHHYLRHVAADVCSRYLKHKGSPLSQTHPAQKKWRVINSKIPTDAIVGDGSLIINCHIQHPTVIGSNCFLSGVTDSFLELQVRTL